MDIRSNRDAGLVANLAQKLAPSFSADTSERLDRSTIRVVVRCLENPGDSQVVTNFFQISRNRDNKLFRLDDAGSKYVERTPASNGNVTQGEALHLCVSVSVSGGCDKLALALTLTLL